jgi:hypothetical protein
MAITNFQVGTGTGTPAYTATAETAVTVIYITNKSSAAGTIDVYITPNGQAVSENFKIYNQLTIPAQDTYIIDTEKTILEIGAKIFIAAPDSAAQFNATISTIGL